MYKKVNYSEKNKKERKNKDKKYTK